MYSRVAGRLDRGVNVKITFLGGAGTVTGSKYLLETEGQKILVDCGLFQGLKELRLRNWAPFPLRPRDIDAVVLTHAHIDHSGYLPLLVRDGFRGPVYATSGTRDLCDILLPDSGYLMEREADHANRWGFSKHHPAKPLYTRADAIAAMSRFRTLDFGEKRSLGKGTQIRFRPAGHILGAAILELWSGGRKIVFSGDLGRPNSSIMLDSTPIAKTDYLVVESTYGDRLHEAQDPEDALADIINRTSGRGGKVLIPSFAVGRVQTLLFHLYRLKQDGRILDLPIFLDSPMAINATALFSGHVGEHRLTADQCAQAFGVAEYVHRVEDSKTLDHSDMPMVVISASGMATGGRVVHHLKHFAPDHRNTILFAGFQAPGTRGDRIVRGEAEVKMLGQMVPIRAEVHNLQMMSAHADQAEMLAWLRGFRAPPQHTFVTHGGADASAALAQKITEEFGWGCLVPAHEESVMLG